MPIPITDDKEKLMARSVAFVLRKELWDEIVSSGFEVIGNELKEKINEIENPSSTMTYQNLHVALSQFKNTLAANGPSDTKACQLQTTCEILLDFFSELEKVMNESNTNLLHIAAGYGFQEYVNELINQYGFPADMTNNDGMSPRDFAKDNNHDETVRLLEKFLNQNQTDQPEPVNHALSDATKKLYLTFGITKLKDIPNVEFDPTSVEGGHAYEGYQVLIENLEAYKSQPHVGTSGDSAKINAIIKMLKTFQVEEKKEVCHTFLSAYQQEKEKDEKNVENLVERISHLEKNNSYLVSSGFLGHEISGIIEKKDDGRFELYLADRAGFLEFSSSGDKFRSIKSLSFDKEHLTNIIKMLVKAEGSVREEGLQILEKDIPRITKTKYVENTFISQSHFKENICYFGNPKAILRLEFDRQFGSNGKNKYKNFMYFLREKSLKDYRATEGHKDELAAKAEEVLKSKRSI